MTTVASKLVATVACSAMMCSGTGAAVAATDAAPGTHKTATSLSRGLEAVGPTTDQAMAQLLLTGTGPAAAAHPVVVRLLGFDRIKGRASQDKIVSFVDAFLAGTPGFHDSVASPLATGDPYQVRSALVNVTSELKTFLSRNHVQVHHADTSMMSPQGWWRTVTNGGLAVNVVAAANGGLYANVAVATEVAVAAAVVWLAGVFLTYKFDPASTDRLDHDIVVATIAKELRAA